MAKRKKVASKTKKPTLKPRKKPVRKSRRVRKLAPVCNGFFCGDPKCKHANKDNKDSKKCPGALKKIQKREISKKQPAKRQNNKLAKCPKKKNRRKKQPHVYARFLAHVSARCRNAGIKQTDKFNYMEAAGACWRALTPQQKEVFKCGGTEDTKIFKAGTAPGCPSVPGPGPVNTPPAPAPAPQAPSDLGPRPGNSYFGPYFHHGNFPF